MFEGRTVAVVIPARDEEATIEEVARSYGELECVDRVVVVDNRCTDRTAERAREGGAEVVEEERPGYGHAIARGLDHAFAGGAEVAIVTEADGSFAARDAWKLLHYLGDAQLVLGTRTTRQMVQQAANMSRALRVGNLVMAKLLELFWWWPDEPRLTDVGCTYRALGRDAWERLGPTLRERGPAFSPEMIARAYALGMRVIEIPVHYGARLGGASKHTASLSGAARTAAAMLRAICRVRMETLGGPPPAR